MLTRGGPYARGCSFDWAWWCDGPWARSLDDRTSFQFLAPKHDRPRQRAIGSIARSTRPVDAGSAEYLICLRRSCSAFHRVARHDLCNCSRGVADEKAKTGVKGPYRLSKIHGRLSE